ncbi:hypothetical protein H8356DRAFT_996394 [Neocallimastix lanati (nom. inval.)]|uniref:18S rRNA factor 2 n=1 Tax=Neocallimastix californiae TaxID=1754190 RepID=A0A1Y1ZYS5_9FUNG|nr:hypothetical protein H8356DRAFT_996394 [Neocallimastix sp. JGI-2020a]ORY15364.1 hypothetical protein LY90DRAFT_708510 [Neocallimastix californiae]|eukprot:ORY15364.1 hypothetical protein LY90DRAFT_708510 [Neocallimastix californiae]
MDDIFNIHESESENEEFSDEEENINDDDDNDENDGKENDDNDENDVDNENDINDNDKKNTNGNVKDNRFNLSQFNDVDDKDEKAKEEEGEDKKKKKVKKPLSENKIKKFNVQHQKTGVVYLSKIPPFMKPIKLRHLLSRYAKIGRIYLAAEDEKIAHRRKKYGGNRKRNYTEGWVEFLDKREAKLVVKHLNNHIIGGKKSSWYHDDIWNMKYLHGFKWIHLTERIAYEKAVRAQKLKAEMAQASRESNVIIRNVEKAKMIESMEKRKLEKLQDNEESSVVKKAKVSESNSSNNDSFQNPETIKIIRKYKQRKPVNPEKKTEVINPKQKSVLSKIFS